MVSLALRRIMAGLLFEGTTCRVCHPLELASRRKWSSSASVRYLLIERLCALCQRLDGHLSGPLGHTVGLQNDRNVGFLQDTDDDNDVDDVGGTRATTCPKTFSAAFLLRLLWINANTRSKKAIRLFPLLQMY